MTAVVDLRLPVASGKPVGFDAFMESALYGQPGGFYASGGGAGRRTGDYLTSVEVGPLFGRLVARLADRCWTALGRPERLTLVDAGAGRGTLARSVLAAGPECSGALRYVLVERSAALRAQHRPLLERPPGPCAELVSLADLPTEPFEGLVFANELLDNLPVRLLERTGEGWAEVHVVASSRSGDATEPAESTFRAPAAADDRPAVSLSETLVPVGNRLAARAGALAPTAPVGGRIPLAAEAVDWVSRALSLLRRGRLVAIDYADSTPSLAARPVAEWLRTYRGGRRGHDPLVRPGGADITCEVALDQLTAAHPGAQVAAQADFLADLGIGVLVAEGRAVWAERAAVGDLAALEARSRITEAEALCDPTGLGAFKVLTWTTGVT